MKYVDVEKKIEKPKMTMKRRLAFWALGAVAVFVVVLGASYVITTVLLALWQGSLQDSPHFWPVYRIAATATTAAFGWQIFSGKWS